MKSAQKLSEISETDKLTTELLLLSVLSLRELEWSPN